MQTEKPSISAAELASLFRMPVDGIKAGGGQIQNFRRGWALSVLRPRTDVAHWFERDAFDQADALCGVTASVRWLYGQGNFTRCQHCIRIMSKNIKAGR